MFMDPAGTRLLPRSAPPSLETSEPFMPDHRRHRGPHPDDRALFEAAHLPTLRVACAELSWLLSRGYAETSSLKLVGDRHQLHARQRLAVLRCSASDPAAASRLDRLRPPGTIAGLPVVVDGHNLVITLESALAGAPLLVGRDGNLRDLASLHGTYRLVEETAPAIESIAETLEALGVSDVEWLFDAPVSNSGRLAAMVREVAARRGCSWEARLEPDPDPLLERSRRVVASADSRVLDACGAWTPLASEVVRRLGKEVWFVDIGGSGGTNAAFAK